MSAQRSRNYRGRLAPSPTGFLHLGHARTFWVAQQRAKSHKGVLVLRNEDLDRARCRPEFLSAMIEDLKWFGFEWQEGPDCGGPFAPYAQSERLGLYRFAFEKLEQQGYVYPCVCSRQDVLRTLAAPHEGEDEPIYPGTCRPRKSDECRVSSDEGRIVQSPRSKVQGQRTGGVERQKSRPNWRFRVPEGETVSFLDAQCGPQQFVAGKDFGDFVVWRNDDLPSYQLAVAVDDAAMQITEVVRGEDLLKSTARQILLYRALGFATPTFCHCLLVTDDHGVRLAKRHDSLSLRSLRERRVRPAELMKSVAGGAKFPL